MTPPTRRPTGRRPGGARPRSGGARPARRTSASAPAAPRSVRWLMVAAGVLGALGMCLLVLYFAPELQGRHEWLAMAASFAPYGWLTWLVAVVLALIGARGRTRLVAAPLALGLAWHTGVLVPYLPGPARAVAAPQATLTVLELNLRYGQADLAALAARTQENKPDVLVLAEVTASNQKVLRGKAWAKYYPYLLGTVGDDYDRATGIGDPRGTLVVSRYPITELGPAEGTTFSNFAARLDLPGHPITLVAAHPVNPEHGVDSWVHDGESVTRLALAHSSGPLVVAGDMNATGEHLTLRELVAKAGLSDAVAGFGWRPTFPADTWYPPLIQIDHVLVSRQFSTTGYRTIAVPGTDHLGLLVRLALT